MISAGLLVLVVLIAVFGAGAGVRVYARRVIEGHKRRLALQAPADAEATQRRLHLEGWLNVFRETVIASEGSLSSELRVRLSDPEEFERALAEAKEVADRILEAARVEAKRVERLSEATRSEARQELVGAYETRRARAFQGSDEALAAAIADRISQGRGGAFWRPSWSQLPERQKESLLTIARIAREVLEGKRDG